MEMLEGKLIALTISPTSSLFVAQRPSTYSGGTWGDFWETRDGVGKSGVLKRVKIRNAKSYYGVPLGTHQRSFERYTTPTSYGIKESVGVSRDCLIFFELYPLLSQKWEKLRTSNFVCIHRINRNKTLIKMSAKVAVGVLRDSKIVRACTHKECIARSPLR